jgi:site-specific DNA recombinase
MVILLSFSAIFCSLSHIRREKTARSITNCNTSNQIRCWGGKIEKLNKHLSAEERAMIMLMKRDESGCRVISITQQTSDDPAGEMASKMFSLFDEYSSKENGKHTLRAMKENARRGFFNGSRPCFGYRAVECYMDGDNTRKKKRAEIDPSESAIVRNIFDYYLNGHQGCVMGAREIALHLNTKGISLRGNVWNKSRVHEVLSNRAYIGEYYFNKRDHKTKTLKAESEWILLTVEPIIDEAVFESVRIKRESRAPAKISPRLVTSPILLTGLLKCGCCGAGITTATGKGGLYRYYKCNTRVNQGAHLCSTPAIPMDKLDSIVMDTMLDKILVPDRLKIMLAELRKLQKANSSNQDELQKPLNRELAEVQAGTTRLYEAVEKGLLPQDEFLQQRAQKLKARREEIMLELAGLKRKQAMPLDMLNTKRVDQFAKAMRQIMTERRNTTGKAYLRLLIDEIRIEDDQATITGSDAALAFAMLENTKADTVVPTFVPNWLPDLDSNQGPAD